MQFRRALAAFTSSLILLMIASGCGVVKRVSEDNGAALRDEIAAHTDSTIARLSSLSRTDVEIVFSDTVTLSQLQQAGIPVGSDSIDCDQPLHIVVIGGMFERENLFENATRLAGGTEYAFAMRLVAEIYDPETAMPLGMVGDQTGNSLGQISAGNSSATPDAGGDLLLDTSGSAGDAELIPEAVCP